MIAASMAAAFTLGLLYLAIADPIYTAQTQILIDPGLPNVLRDQSIEPPMAMDSQQAETEIAVLRSERVASAVIERLSLADDPEYRGSSLSELLGSSLSPAAKTPEMNQDKMRRALLAFQKTLVVRRIGVSYAIDVLVNSSSADKSTLIANTIAEEYIRFQSNARANAAKVGSEWLEKRLGELRAEMNDASRKMQEHRARQDYSIGGSMTRQAPPGSTPVEDPEQGRKNVETGAGTAPLSFEDLESTANTTRRIYENYLQSYMAAVQRQSFPISNARVITRATRPLSQSRSNGLILSMALMLGALAGVGLGVFRDRAEPAKQTGPASKA